MCFVLDGHLVPIAQLVARYIFRLATYLCLAGSAPAGSPFSVVSLNIFYFWVSSITEQSSDIKIRCDRIRVRMAKWKNSSIKQIDVCQNRHFHFYCHHCLFVILLASWLQWFLSESSFSTPPLWLSTLEKWLCFFFLYRVSYRKKWLHSTTIINISQFSTREKMLYVFLHS